MTHLQAKIIRILEGSPGIHFLGSALAAMVGVGPRQLRWAIRRLRLDHNRMDILSHAGDDPATDGYWISKDAAEIEANRKYHEQYGKDHFLRAGRMTAEKCLAVAEAQGQEMMNL